MLDGGTGEQVADEPTGGDWRELDRRLRRLARRRAADDVEEATCLRRARAEGLHRHFGYASFYEYAERVLGYTPGVVRERMRVADALVGLPKLCAAMTAGDVVYSAARSLTRVATAANEDAWLAATARASVRDIEDMVAGRRRGDPPDAPPDPAARLHERRFLLTGAVLGAYIAARARLETACGHPLSDSEVLDALCAASLAGTAATDPATRPPPYQIAITRCADCARAWVDAAGQSVELSATELARASCDAELLGRVDSDAPPRATKTIPPRIRRAVLRRDRGRCRVPGCKYARFVDVHHVVPRGKGGDHTPSRLAAMCSAHHQAAHDGRLKVDLDKRGRLRIAHADGRPYGSPPPPRVAAPGESPAAPSAPAAATPAPASSASTASTASHAGAQDTATPHDSPAGVPRDAAPQPRPAKTAPRPAPHLGRRKAKQAARPAPHVGRRKTKQAAPRPAPHLGRRKTKQAAPRPAPPVGRRKTKQAAPRPAPPVGRHTANVRPKAQPRTASHPTRRKATPAVEARRATTSHVSRDKARRRAKARWRAASHSEDGETKARRRRTPARPAVPTAPGG